MSVVWRWARGCWFGIGLSGVMVGPCRRHRRLESPVRIKPATPFLHHCLASPVSEQAAQDSLRQYAIQLYLHTPTHQFISHPQPQLKLTTSYNFLNFHRLLHTAPVIMSQTNGSLCRQNYHQECEANVNKQINMELYASYVYMSMVSSKIWHYYTIVVRISKAVG